MEKEMVATIAEWNVEMLSGMDRGVTAFVQSHKEGVAQLKDLVEQGYAHAEKLAAPMTEMVRKSLADHPEAGKFMEMPLDLAGKLVGMQRKGAVAMVDGYTRLVEQGAEQVHKGTGTVTELWNRAQKVAGKGKGK